MSIGKIMTYNNKTISCKKCFKLTVWDTQINDGTENWI